MHPLRLLLLISLIVAIGVAWGFGAALDHAGVGEVEARVLAVLAFVAFMIPWAGVSLWTLRRARDLDELTDRAHAAAERSRDHPLTDRAYHGELDDLARAIEELRAITIRQSAAYEEQRRAMTEIVGSLGEGLLAVDARSRVVFANPRFTEMFDATREVVGRSVVAVLRKEPVVHAIEAALRGETATDRITVAGGAGERLIEIRAVPVAASDVAAVALFIDVTEIERLERVRREFLDDFSHEIRTPLAGLRAAIDTLESGDLPRESEQQLRAILQRQLARIERFVKDLSELNRIESREVVLEPRPVALRELLDELCEERNERVRISGDGAVARLDRDRAQQIFANLLDNAVKHGGGGAITIDVASEEGEAVVRVSDEGAGIPPHELERIFHRFYRVDRSRSAPGSGLGLAIAKHLVAAQGGTIRAYNRAGGGATFEVRFPAEELT
jgi:two-component system phosphate regulon sensor histidine kinase PhoR